MKAYVLNGINQLNYEEVKEPVLNEGRVLVEVKASGICGSDIPRIFENGTYHFPTIPGHEFSGIVRKVYAKEQEKWIGKRVGIFPLIPCQKCISCQEKKYEMCSNYDYLGSRSDGGYAEYVSVPEWNLIELPDGVSYEAAAMLEPIAVGIHALKQINLSCVKSAVVFGCGTIGLLMAQWLRIFGVEKIILVGTKEKQRIMAEQLQFYDFINTKTENAVERVLEMTGTEGADVCIEGTGYSEVLSQCLNCTKRGGDVLVVGNPHGDVYIDKDTYWKLLRKQLRISGTWNSSYIPELDKDDWRTSIENIMNGRLKPELQITHRLSFDELDKGLRMMRDKKEYYNKVMLVR